MNWKPVIRSLFGATLALTLTSCSSAPYWLRGDWHYDQQRTEQVLKDSQASASKSNDMLGGMMSGLANTLDSELVQQLIGMEVIITGQDEIVTVGGQGKSRSYQVIKSSSDECVLKMKDCTIDTYYRDGDDIYSYSTGAGAFRIYFKRQP